MKRILTITFCALISLNSFCLERSNYGTPIPKRLSITHEAAIPGASAEQLRLWFFDWAGEFLHDTYTLNWGIEDNIVCIWTNRMSLPKKIYSIDALLFISYEDGKYFLELTDITPHVRESFLMKHDLIYMTNDGSGTKTLFARHYKEIRREIEEDLFPALCQSIYTVMQTHAEIERSAQ